MNTEKEKIEFMEYGETKQIIVITAMNYSMKVCVTRVFGGWLFVEDNSRIERTPINWFVPIK